VYRILAITVTIGFFIAAYYLARNNTSEATGRQNRRQRELWLIRTGPALSPALLLLPEYEEHVATTVILLTVREDGFLLGGTFVLAVGLGLLLWARRTIGRNFDPQLQIKTNHVLVRNGPYRMIRHPVYASYTVIWVGLLVMFGNILFSGFTATFVAKVLLRIPGEERMLKAHFGEAYREYAKHTRRVIPYVV